MIQFFDAEAGGFGAASVTEVPVAVKPSRDEKYQSIIDSAVETFFRRGFVAGTTREVAERIGLTQPAIYHYVGNKDALLVAITLFIRDQLAEAFDRATQYGDLPTERLRGLVIEYTRTVAMHRKAVAVYWEERKHLDAIDGKIGAEVRRTQRGFLNTVEKLVQEAQQRGELPSGEASVIAEGIFGMASWVYQWYQEDRELGPAEVADVFCNLIGLPAGKPSAGKPSAGKPSAGKPSAKRAKDARTAK